MDFSTKYAIKVLDEEMMAHVSMVSSRGVDTVLAVADRYRCGLYPFLSSNTDLATRLYNAVLAQPCNVQYHNKARHALMSMVAAEDQGVASTPMNTYYGITILEHIENVQALPRIAPPGAVAAAAGIRRPVADTQNVHDHFVKTSIDHIIDSVLSEFKSNRQGFGTVTPETICRTVFKLDELHDHIHNIIKVCKRLSADEVLLLNAVLWKIKQQPGDSQKDLVIALGQNIASAFEAGHVVCLTGRKSRIVSVVQLIDENMAKFCDMTSIRAEVMNLAVRIRDTYISERRENRLLELAAEGVPQPEKHPYVNDTNYTEEEGTTLCETFLTRLHADYDSIQPKSVVDIFVSESNDYF